MTAFRAAFKAYRMHQVLIMPRFARLTIALGLATAVFPVDAEYYFNPRFLSNDLAESVDLSAFTKGREAPPGGFAPIFPDTCYHLIHYWPAAADIPVASDNPVHYADAIRYNARTPLQGSLLPLTRLVWA